METNTPIYFEYISYIFANAYLYIFIPITIMLSAYILVSYTINMVKGKGEGIGIEKKFRRGVAAVLPFVVSLYSVLISESGKVNFPIEIPFYIMLIIGLLTGFLFAKWISSIKDKQELFAVFSCFMSSLIFFSIVTVFVITKSFAIISFIFGFLIGASIYITRYGFENLDLEKFKFEMPTMKIKKNINKEINNSVNL